MRRLLPPLLAALALHGCRDFDDALTRCAVNRICTDGTSSTGFTLAIDSKEVAVSGIGSATTKLAFTFPTNFFGSLALRLAGAADAGLYATFQPQPAFFYDTVGTLTIRSAGVPAGTQSWTLDVVGAQPDGGTERMRESLKVTVAPASVPTLVIDDDRSDDNINADNPATPLNPFAMRSARDVFFATELKARGARFDTWVQPYTWMGGNTPLTLDHLKPYASIVWYMDDSYTEFDCLTTGDEAALNPWLDLGNKTLVLLSEEYAGYQAPTAWDMLRADKPLAANYVGVIGGDDDPADDGIAYELLGVAGQPSAGLKLRLLKSDSEVSLMNVKPGTQALFTARGNPDGTMDRDLPIASIRRNVGAAGTSTVVYVGFSVFHVAATAAGTREAALKAILDAAGL